MRERPVIRVLIIGVLIYGLAMGTTYPLLGVMLADSVSLAWNGINAAATGLGLLAGVFLVPVVGRRLGSGGATLVGVGLMVLSIAGLSLADGFSAVFAARLLLGCGAGLLFVVAETALNVFAAPSQRGRVMGLYTAAVALGFVIGPLLVAAFAETPTLILLACAAVTAAVLWPLLSVRRPIDRAVRPTAATRILPAIARYPVAFGFLFMASAVDAVAISLLPVISVGQAFSIERGALFVAIFHVGLLVGQPMVGLALDGLGRRRTILGCCLLSLFCTGLLVFGGQLGFWPVALLMLVWGGANFGLYTAGLALIGDRFSGAALTAATAAFAGVYAIAASVSPILAGWLVDGVSAAGFYLAVSGLYLAAVLYGAVGLRPAEPTLPAPLASVRSSGDH